MARPSLTVYLAATSAFMGALCMGAVLVWTAMAFDSMEAIDSVPRVTQAEEDKPTKSWIVSIAQIGALFGGLISNMIAQKFGLKKSLCAYGIPFTIGWILIFLAKSVPLILVGRVITGFCAGLVSGAAPSYVNDISTANVRGLLGSLFQVFVTIGILLCDCFGSIKSLSWRYLALISLFPGALMSLMMFFMPETPIWLMVNERPKDARESLKRLRKSSNVDYELREIEKQADQTREIKFSFGLLKRPDVYKPLILSILIMFFQQFCGVNAVLAYSGDIFKASSSLDPSMATIMVALAQVIATLSSGFLLDRLGRKIFLIISGSGMALSTIVLGYYYYKNPTIQTDHSINGTTSLFLYITTEMPVKVKIENSYGWVPVVCLVIFIISFSVGYGPIPWMLMPEMTMTSARNIVCSIGTAFNWSMAFLLTKEFIDMEGWLHEHGTFWFFGAVCIAGVIFVIIFVPETKGKTIEEMQAIFLGDQAIYYLNKNNSNDINSNYVTTVFQ